MQILKGDLSNIKGIPPSGLCVGVHRAGAVHQKMVEVRATIWRFWSLRPDLDFIAFKKEGWRTGFVPPTIWNLLKRLGRKKLIYWRARSPTRVREKRSPESLTLLADATCPFVTQQEEAEVELLQAGCHLVVLSSRTHHGIPDFRGLRRKKGERSRWRNAQECER